MAAAGAAAAAAALTAIKSMGVLVTIEPEVFLELAERQTNPLIVHAPAGFFGNAHRYLMSYKGLAFTTRSTELLAIPYGAELIESKSIAIPG